MSHPEFADLWVDGHPTEGMLHEGLDGQLPPTDAALVAEHVAHCADCRARVAEAHGFIAATHRILSALHETPTTGSPAIAATPEVRGGIRAPHAPNLLLAVVEGLPALSKKAIAATPLPFANKATAQKVVTQQPTAKPVSNTKPSTPSRPLPWKLLGSIAAVIAFGFTSRFVWQNLDHSDAPVVVAKPAPIGAPVDDPKDANTAVEPAFTRAAPPAKADEGRRITEAVAADPQQRTRIDPLPKSSARSVAEKAIGADVYDSLVLTRRTCSTQCDEYDLHVSNTGTVRYVEHVNFGQPRVVQDKIGALKRQHLAELLSTMLFQATAVPPTGHTTCSVTDSGHLNTLRIVVSKGTASQAVSANNCRALSKDLLKLGLQIDSIVGTKRLQQLIPDR